MYFSREDISSPLPVFVIEVYLTASRTGCLLVYKSPCQCFPLKAYISTQLHATSESNKMPSFLFFIDTVQQNCILYKQWIKIIPWIRTHTNQKLRILRSVIHFVKDCEKLKQCISSHRQIQNTFSMLTRSIGQKEKILWQLYA